MALSETTINKHNIKRAEVFAANGLGDHDVAFAHPNFEGCNTGGDVDCILCGHRHICYQFSIRFETPDVTTMLGKIATGLVRTEEVTLKYVGSKCITDWLDAIPESAAKLEILKRWHVEMQKMKQAMVAKVVADLCLKAGYESPEAAYEAYASVSKQTCWKLTWAVRSQLKRNKYGVKNATAARNTVKVWLANLATLLALVEPTPEPTPPAPKAEPEAPKPVDPKAALLAQADAQIAAGDDANLAPATRKTYLDIVGKGKKWGLSDGQAGYLAKMISWAEPKAKVAPLAKPAPKPVAVIPGDVSYKSASGVVGARY